MLAAMGSVGDALDNAVAESFFASMQTKLLERRQIWDSRTQLAITMFEWIEEFSDRQRGHSTLDYKTAADTTTRAARPRPRPDKQTSAVYATGELQHGTRAA